jgi:two-component system chemotaxis response regulator CheB
MRVLLVEDSRTVRTYVEAALSGAPEITLLPPVSDGHTAVLVAQAALPDLILMDLFLPGLDGVSAIAEIMASAPCPIVVLSGHLNEPDRDRTFESLRAGAVEVLAKPQSLSPEVFAAFRQQLQKTVRLMKDARVIRRRGTAGGAGSARSYGIGGRAYDVVVIGASTGGPPLLSELLTRTPPPCTLPVVIAQHTLQGFETSMAQWLGRSGHAVQLAVHGAPLRPGVVYLAPPDLDCRLGRVGLTVQPLRRANAEVTGPCIDNLFLSAAEAFGARCAAFLLSGMGDDGARGLLALRRSGALTVAQSGESCVVDGMPAAARALGAPGYDLPPAELIQLFQRLSKDGDGPVIRSSARP